MPASPFRANLDALARHSASVAGLLEPLTPRPDMRPVDTPSGCPSARIGARALHSLYDPVREARRLVEGTVTAQTTCCVVLGLGLGYHVEALMEAHPGLPVAVVEPDLPLLAAALRTRDLSRVLGSPDLRLYLGATPEEVASALEELPLGETAILSPSALVAQDPGYYRRVEAAVRAAVDRSEINTNTLARFGRLWVRNLLHNVDAFVSSPGVASLEGRFRDLPALVVAAGPSLDLVEPLLPEIARRAVVIAVDSSLGVCLRAGVRPDFLVTVDPQYWNTRYFDRLATPGTLLICEPSTHPAWIRRAGLRTVFTSSLFPLGRLLETAGGEKGRVGAGGSVATSAWDIARLVGCRPIWMAGLDLGFPNRRTHVRGLYFEELMVSTGTRTLPTETQGHRYLTDAGSLRAPSTAGGTTITDRRMLVYRWWFERQLARPGAPETRTLSADGLRIQGMEWMDRHETLHRSVSRPRIDAAMDHARSLGPRGSDAREAALRVLGTLRDELSRLESAAADGQREARELARDLDAKRREGRRITARLARLDAIDGAITATSSRDVVGFLMQPLIHAIIGSRGTADVVGATLDLYRELSDSARLHLRLVDVALERLRSRSS